jgi:GT2 family glycosyltransferase
MNAGISVQLITVENGPEGHAAAAALRSAEPTQHIAVHQVTAPQNLGFAGGMNLACRHAHGSVLVVANLDLEFADDFMVELEGRFADLSTVAFVAPSVRTPGADLEELGALRRDHVHRLRLERRDGLQRGTAGRARRVNAGSGSCIVLTRATYEERVASNGDLFDPEYHSYYEDVDLFWWAEDNAMPVLFDPALRVLHHRGGSCDGQIRFGQRPADIQASVMANYRLTVWKHTHSLADLAGWLQGEAGYIVMIVRSRRLLGLGVYLRSWRIAVRRVIAIRRRRGRLRSLMTDAHRVSTG